MKWETHKRITYIVCRKYGLPEPICKKISDASILPDKDQDYRVICKIYGRKRMRLKCYRRPIRHHHHEALNIAFHYLFRARKLFLLDKDYTLELGKTLHYLQDYAIFPATRFWIFTIRDSRKHLELENKLEHTPIDSNIVDKILEEVKKNIEIYPHEFLSEVIGGDEVSDPETVMEIAIYNTALAFKLILNPDKPPELERLYRDAKIFHLFLLISPWILPLIFFNPFTIILSIIGSLILHKIDKIYHNIRIDYEWFNTG